jgi:O-antigen ligase
LTLAADRVAEFQPTAPARRGFSLVGLRDGLLYISVLVSFFVMVEPSPNEVLVSIGLLILLATGISFPRLALPLVWMLIALNVGGAMSALPVFAKDKVALFVLISVFLALYTIYFVILFSENTQRRLELMRSAWILGAVIASIAGIVGYFNIGGTRDLFTLYASRAKGTFNDPNVFGPFLILPMLFLIQGFLTGATRKPLRDGLALLILIIGLFLSFSRAAWGHGLLSIILLVGLMVVVSRSSRFRARVTMIIAGGAVATFLGLAALASIPEVREILLVRASLNQEYDMRAGGRFDNFRRAIDVILDNPNGIGPFEFGRRFGEDPHNAYIHTFIAYGWMGGMAYLAMVVSTLWLAWRHVWARTPFQPYMIAVTATYTVLALISFIIHSDHWRHYFLLMALVWALAAATRRHIDAGRPA